MSGLLDGPAPRWFTIGAHRPFLDDLAQGLWRSLDRQTLAEAMIFLPTRRAGRALAESFLKAAKADGAPASLLPAIRTLGDLDEDDAPFEEGAAALDLPPAIEPLRRRFELARLVVENEALLERRLLAASALGLADSLAGFLDGCHIAGAGDAAAVESLVEGELARHWQVSARFLSLILEAWPKRLAELGLMDIAERSAALARALAARWREHPPAEVLIAAGSTGADPATAALLAAAASAPRGCVVLPGLDKSLADAAWDEVGESHPQGAMKRLLETSGVSRADVDFWDPATETDPAGRWRRRLINESLRPPERTADWLAQIEALRAEGGSGGVDPIAKGLAGLTAVTAASEEEAATLAALLLRETLNTPGKTAALVTPDPDLARRVSARMTRWNVAVDTSAGQVLAATPVAVLASLVARAAADPDDPVSLLGILKHPLTRLGLDEETLARARRRLERSGLRGRRPRNWDDLLGRLAKELRDPAAEIDLAERLRAALEGPRGAFDGDPPSVAEATRALAGAMEALAGGPELLWTGPAGEGVASLLAEVIGQSDGLPAVTSAGYSLLLDALLAGEEVRSGGAAHPRLAILGVLEARLVRADRLILAGLDEGVWPRAAPTDPFLSRPMRLRLGLPAPERRIGLSAHDFAQGACAPEVVLLNTERRGGAPAVASRWLWRLRTLAKGAGLEIPGRPDLLDWARALDAPLADPPPALRTAVRPRPTPPVSARPRALSVTNIERWLRDPYAIYARYVLRLRPLDPPDAPVEALARGTAIHAAFERFTREHPEALPAQAETLFAAMLIEELERAGMTAGRMTREHALAANVAPWVMDFEARRRPGARLLVEAGGELVFPAPGGEFKLTAKADRIEVRGGSADVLDFKTGAAPSSKQVKTHMASQLTLTAAIIARGGFAGLEALEPGELLYVRVSGGRVPGREESRASAPESRALAEEALAGLSRRVAHFDKESTPYASWVAPQYIGRLGGDYDHLARLWEWHVIGEGDGEGGA